MLRFLKRATGRGGTIAALDKTGIERNRWAVRQLRLLEHQKDEVIRASADLETDGHGFGATCEKLTEAAGRQSERMSELLSLAAGIVFDGRSVPVDEVGAIFSTALDEINAKIVEVARNAMTMVYALERATGNLGKTDQCIARIDIINGKTNMLAINAMIEAVRAGDNGTAFHVIANEIRELSKLTKGLAQTMRDELGAVVSGVRESHAALREVANIEMSQNILARERLDQLVAALAQRNRQISAAADAAALESSAMRAELDRIARATISEERVQRRLRRIVDALAGAAADLSDDAESAAPHDASGANGAASLGGNQLKLANGS